MRPGITTLPTGLERQRALIDAALAVNDAPTLSEAFQALADAALEVLGADRLTVVEWCEDLSSGTVTAVAGEGADWLGAEIPSDEQTVAALVTGAAYAGLPVLDGLEPELAQKHGEARTVVRVPLVTDASRATFHAGWLTELTSAELEEAAAALHTLTRLTSLAERALRQEERARLDFVLEGVADGVVIGSAAGVVLNDAARRILAVPADTDFRSWMVNPRSLDGVPFEIDRTHVPGQTALERNGAGARFRIAATALDGRDVVLDGSVAPAGSGTVIVFRDVTDEHRENQLNRQTLGAVFDAMPTGISIADPVTHEVLSVNRRFCDLVGLPEEEIVGSRPPFPWWDEDEDAGHGFAPGSRFDRVFRRPDGRPQPVEISVHAVSDGDGEPALLLALVEDVSEGRRLQQQLVQSGKLAAIGELAAGVAHEINNPLFAILGLTEFLLKDAEPGSKPHQRLELIQQTGLEIKEIVRALLDFARENAEERHVVALEDVIRSTVDLVRRTNAHKGVELVDTYDDSLALVSASPNQLKQIALNLIANARQAMPNGGTVNVDVRRDGDWAVASVSDDGPGVPADLLDRIFEPFFTTKRQTGGTGLGLSVSLGIAEAHGGNLTVTSTPGRGSTFTLRLPIAKAVSE
jgi:PAS domain S-box-containing protein